MFPVPDGFRAVRAGDKQLLHLEAGHGMLSYEEGLRPRRPAPELVVGDLELPEGFVLTAGSAERGCTCEGELALLAKGTGSLAKGSCTAEYGFIFLDETLIRVVAAASDDVAGARVHEALRQVVVGTRLFLGSPRRRRFLYRPPSGWLATADGWHTTWRPPGESAPRTSLTVPAALPTSARGDVSLAGTLLGVPGLTPPPPLSNVRNPFGLEGFIWNRVLERAEGPELRVLVVTLADDTYDYAARLIAPMDSQPDREIFEALVSTIHPLPRRSKGPESAPASLSFWTE